MCIPREVPNVRGKGSRVFCNVWMAPFVFRTIKALLINALQRCSQLSAVSFQMACIVLDQTLLRQFLMLRGLIQKSDEHVMWKQKRA